jgi:hypothetical protein
MAKVTSLIAIDLRRKFFADKRNHCYQVEVTYCLPLEGARSKAGLETALARLMRAHDGATVELKSQFASDRLKTRLRRHFERDFERLDQRGQAFARPSLADRYHAGCSLQPNPDMNRQRFRGAAYPNDTKLSPDWRPGSAGPDS